MLHSKQAKLFIEQKRLMKLDSEQERLDNKQTRQDSEHVRLYTVQQAWQAVHCTNLATSTRRRTVHCTAKRTGRTVHAGEAGQYASGSGR
jgi:hypothetical protein